MNTEDLKRAFGEEPIFYLKFVSEEDYAKDILSGKLYANTPEYFRNKEIETRKRGQGDKNELKYTMPLIDLKFYDSDTKELQFEISKASGVVQYHGDDNTPMVCFVGIPMYQMKILDEDDDGIIIGFPFSETEYATMEEQFGRYCVLLSGYALLESFSELNSKVGWNFRKIQYVASNYLKKAESYFNPTIDRYFYKDDDLKYQREYRLILACEMPEDHYIKIKPFCTEHGRAKEACYFDSSILRNMRLYVNKQVFDCNSKKESTYGQ